MSKKGTPIENLSDDEKLNIIMKTWMTENPNDPAYLLDNIEREARMTTHMILNTKENQLIYPEEVKDAEIDIYLRNRKNVPKYELLQYMKFSTNENDTESLVSSSLKEEQGPEEEPYDLNIGCVNPLTNTRLLLSFKLKCEFLDHVTPDFASPEHLPHSIFDD